MASEAPRSAGQGRQGRQPKTKGAASSLGTRQDKTTPPAKVEQRAMQMAGFLTQDKTSREEWTVAESGAQDALVVSSKKEIGCGERDEQVQGQRRAARPGRQAPGVLTTTVPTVLEQHGCRTSAVAGARRCPFYVSPSVFLYKQMRCAGAGASASAIPFEFSLRRMFGGRFRRLEDWKSARRR
jgi:hypothetical protein